MSKLRTLAAISLGGTAFALAQPALAEAPAKPAAPKTFGGPITVSPDIVFKPLLDARIRWEDVQQPLKNLSADAETLRVRAGFEVTDKPLHLSLLAEAEGNLALGTGYQAFPYKNLSSSQYRPAYAVVADPQSVALNRLQLQYKSKFAGLTVGRQRINLDDERWVGSVGWRQNEQTFDAARGTLTLAPIKLPLSLDVTYSNSQRTIYGSDGGVRTALDGKFWFIGAGVKTGPITTKGFAYLINYNNDLGSPQAARGQTSSTQTYGVRSTGTFSLAKGVTLALSGSYAQQSNYGTNALSFKGNYYAGEAALALKGFTLKGGYELLGADAGAAKGAWAVQSPLATLHKFDGWADVFLTTPANGLSDAYGGIAYKFSQVKSLKGLNAQVIYHSFKSDINSITYGHEWDAAIGVKTGQITWLAKGGDYIARGGGTTTTRKFWLQAEYGF